MKKDFLFTVSAMILVMGGFISTAHSCYRLGQIAINTKQIPEE